MISFLFILFICFGCSGNGRQIKMKRRKGRLSSIQVLLKLFNLIQHFAHSSFPLLHNSTPWSSRKRRGGGYGGMNETKTLNWLELKDERQSMELEWSECSAPFINLWLMSCVVPPAGHKPTNQLTFLFNLISWRWMKSNEEKCWFVEGWLK